VVADARYRFGPLERRGLIGGCRSGQVAGVAAGLAVAVGLLRADSRLPGVAGALACLGTAMAVVSWRLQGRTVEQWLPVVVRWAGRRVRGDHRFRSSVPALGFSGSQPHGPGPGSPGRTAMCGLGGWRVAPAPPALAGCRILAPPVEDGGLRVGVVHDERVQSYTAVLVMGSAGLTLLGAEERHARVRSWAEVLAGLAQEGSAIHRVQWVERAMPGPPLPPGSQELDGPEPARRSYAELLEGVGGASFHHEVLLALSVRGGRGLRARARRADAEACATLIREVRSFEVQLRGAGFAPLGVLAPRALVACLRNATQERPQPTAATEPGARPWWPWPLAAEATWSAYRTGATWHATYWVAEWPRLPVGPDFLAPLLLQAAMRRTVALTMEPLGPERARRQAERDRTSHLADAELRRRGGYLATARRQREREAAAMRELELADGHAPYRFSGYVTVTAGSAPELEAASRQLEQLAAQAHLQLLRLYGDQEQAFTWTLPLARGLA
jgi:hypothetical protein